MARILHDGEWYDQMSSEAIYEEEYERILASNAGSLFPSHFLIPLKMAVASESGTAKPDFALVHKEYSSWWVVEAELAHHSLTGHVLPQVQVLSRAEYGEGVAESLISADARLDEYRMRSVVKGQQPRVLVIVNSAVPLWIDSLKPYGALLTVVEIFRSRHNRHLYRMNGEQPLNEAEPRCRCVVELARFLRVLAPGLLPIRDGDQMPIHFRGGVLLWKRLDLKDRVYLTCQGPVSLHQKRRYELIQRDGLPFMLVEQ